MKICSRCKEEKLLQDFGASKNRKDGYNIYCKLCARIKSSEWKASHPGYHIQYMRSNTRFNATLKLSYGITLEEYNDLLDKHNNKCAICDTPPPEVKTKYRFFCVDHCHRTQRIRGLLCRRCNLGLGHFLDDPLLLRKAGEYLVNDANPI